MSLVLLYTVATDVVAKERNICLWTRKAKLILH